MTLLTSPRTAALLSPKGDVSVQDLQDLHEECWQVPAEHTEGGPPAVSPQPDPVPLPFPGGVTWVPTSDRDTLCNSSSAGRLLGTPQHFAAGFPPAEGPHLLPTGTLDTGAGPTSPPSAQPPLQCGKATQRVTVSTVPEQRTGRAPFCHHCVQRPRLVLQPQTSGGAPRTQPRLSLGQGPSVSGCGCRLRPALTARMAPGVPGCSSSRTDFPVRRRADACHSSHSPAARGGSLRSAYAAREQDGSRG